MADVGPDLLTACIGLCVSPRKRSTSAESDSTELDRDRLPYVVREVGVARGDLAVGEGYERDEEFL